MAKISKEVIQKLARLANFNPVVRAAGANGTEVFNVTKLSDPNIDNIVLPADVENFKNGIYLMFMFRLQHALSLIERGELVVEDPDVVEIPLTLRFSDKSLHPPVSPEAQNEDGSFDDDTDGVDTITIVGDRDFDNINSMELKGFFAAGHISLACNNPR